MKTYSYLLILLNLGFVMITEAQNEQLSTKDWGGGTASTYVFYISGDGGMNKFSTNLCTALRSRGYSLSALNARSYFWNKKSVSEVADDISGRILSELKSGGYKNFSIVGYSFGADVLPFIVNQFPQALRNHLSSVVFISPSATTDFQIHVMDMLGKKQKVGMDVAAAMNQLKVPKSVIIMGAGEKDFPASNVTLTNNKVEILPGGHHYNDDMNKLVTVIISHL